MRLRNHYPGNTQNGNSLHGLLINVAGIENKALVQHVTITVEAYPVLVLNAEQLPLNWLDDKELCGASCWWKWRKTVVVLSLPLMVP